ncbi:retrotransposon protein, putative, ty1-copia subclass [Tanacetum coccineum]
MAHKPFPHQVERAKDLLGLIHTDVCGPFRTVSREDDRYFITFTDDFSHYGYVYLMKHKHKAFETFKVFQNEVENQLGKKIKAIRSDRGGEYPSHEFVNNMKSCGIVSQLTSPYTPQHNRMFERRNQTLLDMVQSMMNLTTLPKFFWGYAFESAARILNMVPTKKIERMPYEIWHGKAPKLSYLRVWGCEALVKRDAPEKLNPRSIKCIFVGYPKETMGYYFYYPPENKIFVARNAEFFQKVVNLLLELIQKNPKEDFGWENSKKVYTLMLEKSDYRKSQGAKTPSEVQRMQRVPYASVIGSIMYAVKCTRPDVAFAHNLCSRFQQNPDKDDTKSQTGYVFVLNGGAMDWKSAKQSTTAMSSTEAEYIVAAKASMKAVWMRKFIDGLGSVVPSNKILMKMLCDYKPAIAMANDLGILKGARHF